MENLKGSTVHLTEEQWDELKILKIIKKHKTMGDTIAYLITVYNEHEKQIDEDEKKANDILAAKELTNNGEEKIIVKDQENEDKPTDSEPEETKEVKE